MALARLALKKNMQQSWVMAHTPSLLGGGLGLSGAEAQGRNYGLLQESRLYSSGSGSGSEGKEVAVQSNEGGRKSSRWRSLLPRTLRRPSLWRRRKNDHPPFTNEMFPPASLGNALLEAAENMNRLFDNIIPSQQLSSPPSQLIMGRFKEAEDSYKLRYDVPGLTKDDLKVTINNGVLRIRGERKVEDEDEDDDEYWMSYGYYDTSLVLPDNAKQDDIKAELKDGVLSVTIPKTEHHQKDVKLVEIN